MAQPFVSGSVEARIQGEISGQVAVGNYNVQIGSIHGGVVNLAAPAQQPWLRPCPSPVDLRPRPFPGLLDRTSEVDAAGAALQSPMPVELHGEPGIGKMVLPKYLAHHIPESSFPDGVVYLSARHQPLADQAANIAAQHRLWGSDAVYAAVALRFGSTLVTLDREQRERVGAVIPTCLPAEALMEWS